jgi:hypothetical protein
MMAIWVASNLKGHYLRRPGPAYIPIDKSRLVEAASCQIAGFYTIAATSIPLSGISAKFAKNAPRYPLVLACGWAGPPSRSHTEAGDWTPLSWWMPLSGLCGPGPSHSQCLWTQRTRLRRDFAGITALSRLPASP